MSDNLSEFSLFELFKAEAASHAQAITDGLLAVEANPTDASQLESLMRAAHSMKGAARILNLDPIVQFAHAMEDFFVAMQKGQQSATPTRVDQLLHGVDFFIQLSELPESKLQTWLDKNGDACRALADQIRAPAPVESSGHDPMDPASEAAVTNQEGKQPKHGKQHPSVTEQSVPADRQPDTGKQQQTDRPDRPATPPVRRSGPATPPTPELQQTVPVGTSNLERILHLAGESMIDARHLQTMVHSLESLRSITRRMAGVLERQIGVSAATKETCDVDLLRQLNADCEQQLVDHATRLEQALWRSERTATALFHEVIGSRMRPFREGTIALPRTVRDLARELHKQVTLDIEGETVTVDRDILRKLEAPLNHLVRNCIDHGIETPVQRKAAGKPPQARIIVQAYHHCGMLTVKVRDDGGGIDIENLRELIVQRNLIDAAVAKKLSHAEVLEFLFLPGFSTATTVTQVSGRGVGLDVVQAMVQEVSGTVHIDTQPGHSTTFTMRLPVSLSVIRAVLAEVDGQPYAFPLSRVQRIVRVPIDSCSPVQGRQLFTLDGESIGLVAAAELFGLTTPPTAAKGELSVVVLGEGDNLCGLVVDGFVGEQDLVVRPLDARLGKVPHISAAATTAAGDPLLIVDIEDLLHSVLHRLGEGRVRGMTTVETRRVRPKPRILVVDDSVTVRELERQLLQAQGYDVDIAVDGRDGWHALCSTKCDLLVTDVDMPRMNGIELIRTLRNDRRFSDLPVIIISYKDRPEDRSLGLEVGANAYLTKGSFHDDSFVTTVVDLLGDIH